MSTTTLPPQQLIDRKTQLIDDGYEPHAAALFALVETLTNATQNASAAAYVGSELAETLSSDFAENNTRTYNLINRIVTIDYENGTLHAKFDLSDYDKDYLVFGGGSGFIIIEPEASLRVKVRKGKLMVLSAEGVAASKSEKKSKLKNFKVKSINVDKNGEAELKVKVGFVTNKQLLKFKELFD